MVFTLGPKSIGAPVEGMGDPAQQRHVPRTPVNLSLAVAPQKPTFSDPDHLILFKLHLERGRVWNQKGKTPYYVVRVPPCLECGLWFWMPWFKRVWIAQIISEECDTDGIKT